MVTPLSGYVNIKDYKYSGEKIKMNDQEKNQTFLPTGGTIDCESTWTTVFNDQIEKEIMEGMKNNNEFTFINRLGSYSTYIQDSDNYELLKPERVIYNDRATICYWKDGTKTVVKTSINEPFVKEFGVALAIVKKLYGSRSAFLRDVANGYESPNKELS